MKHYNGRKKSFHKRKKNYEINYSLLIVRKLRTFSFLAKNINLNRLKIEIKRNF